MESEDVVVAATQERDVVLVSMDAATAAEALAELGRYVVPYSGAPALYGLWDKLGGLPLLTDTEAVA